MMLGKLGRRGLHQFAQQGPGVGHHCDPVTVDLVGEPGWVDAPGQGDARPAGDRAAEADHQTRRMVQRGQTIDRVTAAERGGGGRAVGRQRPPMIGDLLDHSAPSRRAEEHEGEITCPARVWPIPLRQLRTGHVEAVQLDDPVRLSPAEVRGAAMTENEGHGAGRGSRRQMICVGDDVGDLAQLDGGGEVIIGR